jgi:vacuolar-type H+-ATPase subunit I/STV1
MTIANREGVLARVRQIRRRVADREQAISDAGDPQPDRLQALEARVSHLEQLLEGLQDSVHRESERHAKLIAELQGQVQPETMGAALAQDALNRRL